MRKLKKLTGILCLFLGIILSAACGMKAEAADDLVIVLDPGHDNSDAGARRTWDGVTYAEETICLKIAQYCKAALEQYSGVKVYLTRNTNAVSMNRWDRLTYAKSVDADCLISLHCNSWTDASVSYVSAYVPTYSNTAGYAKTARALAISITSELSQDLGIPYGSLMADEGLGIIYYGKYYKMPSMIIEHDFISNKASCQRLFRTDAQMKKVGETDALGIAKYYGLSKTPLKKGWQSDGSYVTTSGVKAKGWITLSGKRYYLNSSGVRVTGWQTIDGKKYYFDSDGAAVVGLLNNNGTLYWMSKKGALRTGFINGFNGNKYYASKAGILYKGFKKYKGNQYYFDPTNGAALKGLKIINGKYYFFDENGIRKTGWISIGGKSYYLNSDGTRKTGWIKYNGKYRFLNRKTGEMLVNKWLRKGSKWYYFKKNGVRVQSTTKVINGISYIFNAKGVCQNKN